MIARNFIMVCTVVAVFAVLISNLVNNHHKYGGVTRLDENSRLR
ncbi:hypothetical protein [Prosthecomicrobium pneumaticum]|uniref:Uncharacterized protein n=1 Tax=Prosthecomicrobium pneumaticum TaxID=81895 RepID=A0A7W9FLX6_9HYPH|nr:hypothetical protein [Prosthecomicrobium pneumaticum]MBB5753041.1 hypothetical protein [Prosthecomicrobium pneumaticum]